MNVLQSNLRIPDYAMIAGYFVLMLAIGVYFYRSMRNIKDYFSGGNNIPWWLSGVSFYMSSFSVAAFIFYPALCYRHGWVGVTLLWVAIPATLFSTLFLARKWRRARIDSPVEYVERRYSATLRQMFAWQGVPVKIIDDGIKLLAIGKFISVGLGFDMGWSMIAAGVIMLLYTFMGGLWAVAVTDFVQFVVLSAAIIIMFPLAFHRAGGVAAVISEAPEGFFHLTAPGYGWGYVAYLIAMYSLAWSSVNWALIQRYYCVPRERDAVKVGLTVIVLYIIGPPIMFLPAIAATRILPGLEDAGDVYPLLCNMLLPTGMLGLVIAAMFAATMSMLSSDYNVCASVLTNDVYRRLFRQDATQRELVLVGRFTTVIVGALALGAALLMAQGRGEDLFRVMVTLFSVATPPVAIPMVLGFLSRKFTARAALLGFISGLFLGLALFGLSYYRHPIGAGAFQWIPAANALILFNVAIKLELALFVGTSATTFLVMLVSTLFHPMTLREKERVFAFFDQLTVEIGLLPEDRKTIDAASVVSPFRIVGLSLSVIALMMLCILPWSGDLLTAVLNAIVSAFLLSTGLVMLLIKSGPRATHPMPFPDFTHGKEGRDDATGE